MIAIKVGVFAIANWRKILYVLLALFVVIFILFFGVKEEDLPDQGGEGGTAKVSSLVMRYEPLVRAAAEKYGVEAHTQLLLAKIMQESGGRVPDVMQSSESIGLPPNTITDPKVSIDVGVRYFASTLKAAGGDYKLALQAYNMGNGYISFAKKRGGHSKKVAQEFSSMMASKMGWSRYGDPNYVDNVLRYFETNSVLASDVKPNEYGFVKPTDTKVTSDFGMRIHPITGIPTLHGGTDYSCNKQAIPIRASKDGVVKKAGWENPGNHSQGFGQRVYVQHSKGLESVYAHLSKIEVSEGQKIKAGETIGKCGTTGSSTGMHLHLEIHLNNKKVNPEKYIGGKS